MTQATPRQVRIVHRWNSDRVLFAFDVPESVASGMEMRAALEAATAARVVLRDADLRGADLRDADLRGADLRDADLRGADLSGAVLRDADLRGAVLRTRATPEESIAALDKVGAIILDNAARLEMGQWHGSNEWKERTCAEEAACETTHCLAGWLQVCSTNPEIRSMDAQTAGILCAPIASKMFFRDASVVLDWLKERKYVGDLADAAERKAERDARKAAEQPTA